MLRRRPPRRSAGQLQFVRPHKASLGWLSAALGINPLPATPPCSASVAQGAIPPTRFVLASAIAAFALPSPERYRLSHVIRPAPSPTSDIAAYPVAQDGRPERGADFGKHQRNS